ncbi:Uncharacterized protein OBRU01_22645 [Operophtera brumata]|uniref:PHD-type domain-containing protein n=1 Tax=Operophtera brumata TaxID=104452 RepID=A0A0L7KR27_OPEBR|nr:Uncharacterized protein OBRU01_22645 [Operophtera brumata]
MNPFCGGCKQATETERTIKCTICEANYHQICVSLTVSDCVKVKDSWKCPKCRVKGRKSDNTITPILAAGTDTTHSACASSATGTPLPEPVSHQRPLKRAASGSPLADINEELDSSSPSIFSELRLLRKDIAEMKSTLLHLSEGIDKCNNRLDSYECRIKTLEEQDMTISSLHVTVAQLKEQLNSQAQAQMKNEIEIMGISEEHGENLIHIAMSTATKVGIDLAANDIDWVARAGQRKISTVNSNLDSKFPRPIIVRLLRKQKRDEMLQAAKSRRNLSSEGIVNAGSALVFVNEHLTKANRLLFREARGKSKESGFKFCWVRNGAILLRQAEGKPAMVIRCTSDLERLFGSIQPTPEDSNFSAHH